MQINSRLFELGNVLNNYAVKKRLCIVNIRYQVLKDWSINYSIIKTNKVLGRRLKMLIKNTSRKWVGQKD